MTEIEIKAHVADPDETERKIRSFANYSRHVVKSDVYWGRAGVSPASRSEPAGLSSAGFSAASAVFTFFAAGAAAVCAIAGVPKEIIIVICLGAALVVAVSIALTARRLAAETAAAERTDKQARKIRIREELDEDSSERETVVNYKRKETRGLSEVNDEREFSINDRAAFEALMRDLDFSPTIEKRKDTKSFSWRAPSGRDVTIELSLIAELGWFVEIEILASEPDETETESARLDLMDALARSGVSESAIEMRYYSDMLAEARGLSSAR